MKVCTCHNMEAYQDNSPTDEFDVFLPAQAGWRCNMTNLRCEVHEIADLQFHEQDANKKNRL